jgi:hypothetical protein
LTSSENLLENTFKYMDNEWWGLNPISKLFRLKHRHTLPSAQAVEYIFKNTLPSPPLKNTLYRGRNILTGREKRGKR